MGQRYCEEHKRTYAIECPVCWVNGSKEERQRKHEATHGWRNPPSVYEEDRSET